MTYLFKGTLKGALCRDCIEPLVGLTLKAYRIAADRDATAMAVAQAKDTFAPVDAAAMAAKASQLLAEAVIDDAGNFALDFSKSPSYSGGAFEVDLYCGSVPHLPPRPQPPTPLQFSITTLQPMWRDVGDARVAAWDYTIPFRYGCGVRSRFGAWTICGHVVHCETKAPIGGVRVRAFDVDWLQDDARWAAAAHPNLGAVSLEMTGPGGPYAFTLPAAVPGERFGTAVASGWNIATLPDCAYIITLGAQVLLTTGDSVPNNVWDQIGFCKK